jgi:AraC-like DNA-binding protein
MTEAPARMAGTPDLLQSAVAQLRLEGAIFFRTELTDAFAFKSTPRQLAEVLYPGADRLILFHIVAKGSCWVQVAQGDRHWACEGDVIVLPYGDEHTIGGMTETEPVPIGTLIDQPFPYTEMPFLRHGGGGALTDLVCGYLYSEDPLFDPALRALPPVFVVRLPDGPAAQWMQASVEFALAGGPPSNESASVISTRLPELLLIEVLRTHLANAPAADNGWIAALHDPALAPALALLHNAPYRRWTVADLAAASAVSRSVLDERFRTVLGRSPIRYLTEWRMHLAEELLATTDLSVIAVARRVGYDSEEAFSRAYKRERGCSPSHWRAARATGSARAAQEAAGS